MRDVGAFSASTTRSDAIAKIVHSFRCAGVERPIREARLILCAACRISPVEVLVAGAAPLGAAAGRLEDFASRRAAGEPMSRIVGIREFWGLALTISPRVLDPRPETETIVEAAITLFGDRRPDALRILDLGAGSGALLCALLSEFANARGLGVDVCAAAAKVALDNIEACGLTDRAKVRAGDWTRNIDGPFDLIVSNPPYIPTAELSSLPREVRDFDPRLAIDGGSDGLDAYRSIIPASAPLLEAGGWLLVEIGANRAVSVLAIASKAGFLDCKTYSDLAGLERVVAAGSPQAVSGGWSQEGADRRERIKVAH